MTGPMRPFVLALALLASPTSAQTSLFDATVGMELVPCDLSALSCTTMTLPMDHMANDPTQTIDITFALSFASVESKGILFYIVGGPGGSGLASAESYLSSFDERLTQYMDVVFVDQRGTGPVHGLACPTAQAIFDRADVSIRDPGGAKAVAQTYVKDCTAELGRDDLLPFVNSDQAIRDSEAFRQAIGSPKVWLYGESYGTQFVQAYATLFPDAVKGVVLDGVVDLNLDSEGFYRRYVRASEAILAETFVACDSDAACRSDLGGDAAAAYDALASRLADRPIPLSFTRADGSVTTRELTLGLLEANAFYALYSPEGRAGFLRVLAAAHRGNLVPMLGLGYSNMYIDPETEAGLEDTGWFSAAYYAITCTDYDSGPGTPDKRAQAIMSEAQAFSPQAPRLLRSYFMERLVCAYWPHQGPPSRPAPYAGGYWPTLVLNGTADPITPASMAYSVFDTARNAFSVTMKNGPHVIWGRGMACPDAMVYDLLIDGTLPATQEQQCKQDFLGSYTPLTLGDATEGTDPVEVARAVYTELYQNVRLGNWDGLHPLTIGCDFGGTLTAASGDAGGITYSFDACRLWADLTVSGSGVESTLGEDSDSIILTLKITGRDTGDIVYSYSIANEAWSIKGTWNGQPAALTRSDL
jgi:pimeloyl-ACP methyl ester carboxylesterase